MDVPSGITSLDHLSDSQHAAYQADVEYQHKVDAAMVANKAGRRHSGAGNAGPAAGVTEEAVVSKATRQSARVPASSAVYSDASPDEVEAAMDAATADKIREVSDADRHESLNQVADHLGVPETKQVRMAFMYSLILWIYYNSASTENSIDSLVGGKYSSNAIIEFFSRDIRPLARSLGPDAKQLIARVAGNRTHSAHKRVVLIARTFGVPKAPWLAYDGIIGFTDLSNSEQNIARAIATRRIGESSVNLLADADVGRGALGRAANAS